jgi:CubicO group peptidase (beta-lactamase class C family)
MKKKPTINIAARIGACLAVCVTVLSCSVVRSLTYWYPEIDDHKIFHSVELTPPATPFTFHEGDHAVRKKIADFIVRGAGTDTLSRPLERYLADASTTTAFLVIRNDSILFEEYYRGYDRTGISTLFSVSKSITSLMTGIAVDDGYITTVDDPVTKYIPELSGKDPRWDRLTVEHLLDMRSGFKFKEDYSGFLSKSAALYYGINHLGKMKRMKFEDEPGSGDQYGQYDYQSATTAMLGLVVQRAVGRNLAEYMQEKVWTPMGMENRATWSIDDRRHRMTKSDSGLNLTARDLAKIGRLYLHHGDWNGSRIVDSTWVARSITPNVANGGYQYQWYSESAWLTNPDRDDLVWGNDANSAIANSSERLKKYPHHEAVSRNGGWGVVVYTGQFSALGIMKQLLWVDPAKNLIIVRLGENGDRQYESLFYNLAKTL